MTKRYDFYETANHKMPYSIGERSLIMEKKLNFSEVKKAAEKEVGLLSAEELNGVSGGRDFSPEQIMIARTIVETYRKMGYTRNDFIKELDGNQLDFDYRALYIDIWDYKL